MTCSLVLVRKEEGKKGPNVQPLSLRRRRPYRDRGGRSRGMNLLWEINGTEGDLQVTADGGQAQIFEMTVRGGNGAQSSLEALPAPQGPSTNVARAYARFARDYREGTHLCPTFDDAVTRHRMLDAIEQAAATGRRQTPG